MFHRQRLIRHLCLNVVPLCWNLLFTKEKSFLFHINIIIKFYFQSIKSHLIKTKKRVRLILWDELFILSKSVLIKTNESCNPTPSYGTPLALPPKLIVHFSRFIRPQNYCNFLSMQYSYLFF